MQRNEAVACDVAVVSQYEWAPTPMTEDAERHLLVAKFEIDGATDEVKENCVTDYCTLQVTLVFQEKGGSREELFKLANYLNPAMLSNGIARRRAPRRGAASLRGRRGRFGTECKLSNPCAS